jgi:hypothetical protein
MIGADGVSTNPKNSAVVQRWATPTNVKEVRGFLGMVGYYRKFVRNFGKISRPFTELLRKDRVFVWNTQTVIAVTSRLL